jgi:hypothetical protein
MYVAFEVSGLSSLGHPDVSVELIGITGREGTPAGARFPAGQKIALRNDNRQQNGDRNVRAVFFPITILTPHNNSIGVPSGD